MTTSRNFHFHWPVFIIHFLVKVKVLTICHLSFISISSCHRFVDRRKFGNDNNVLQVVLCI